MTVARGISHLDMSSSAVQNGKSQPSVASPRRTIVLLGKYAPGKMDGEIVATMGHADALHRAGADLEVWSFSRYISEPKKSQTRTGADIWTLPLYRAKVLSIWMMPAVTRRWIESRLSEVQLFHCHGVFSPIHNLVARLGKPYATIPHGGWNTNVFEGRNRLAKKVWVALSEKRFWSNARFVCATSPGEKKTLEELPGIVRVELAPNGVEIPPPEAISPCQGDWVYIGRLAIDYKGMDRLIRAYAMCRSKGVNAPKLVLGGPDFQGGKAILEKMISELGLEKHVEFVGPVNGPAEKAALLGRASLFLHTSRSEAFPLAILEAMAHGVPVLVTPGTNFADMVNQNGVGYGTGDSDEEIAAAMASVKIEDASAMGMRARRLVENEYTWDRTARRLLQAYRRWCGATFANCELD